MNIAKNTPLERLQMMFAYLISKYIHEFKFKSGYFADDSNQEVKDVNTTFGKTAINLFARLAQPFNECLREAQEAGDINPSINIERLAESIWNGFEGSLVRVKISNNTEPLNAFQRRVFNTMLKE